VAVDQWKVRGRRYIDGVIHRSMIQLLRITACRTGALYSGI
jgi:hypothetical protein